MSVIRLFGNTDHCLRQGSTFAKMAAMAGHKLLTEGNDYDVGIVWFPWRAFRVTTEERKIAKDRRIINDTHLSYLKSAVMKNYFATFGENMEIDPLRHVGPAVEKFDDNNGSHSGRVVTCPIPSRIEDKVYQKVIDNTTDGGMVLDYRVPIVGIDIPFVWEKYRPVSDRFSNTNDHCQLAVPGDVFSDDELDKIKRFAYRIGLDWGELDVLRDRTTLRIYIVDLNNTPMGPPNGSKKEEGELAVRKLVEAFNHNFAI